MNDYRSLLRGSSGALLAFSALGRLAYGISGLAFIVYIQGQTGSFAISGLAIGAFGVASGLLAPLRGRTIDRVGGPAMVVFVVVYGIGNLAVAVTGPIAGGALYVVFSALAGSASPPFTAWTRTALARRIEGPGLRTAYSLDGVIEEAAFVLGPLISGLLIVIANARVAIFVDVTLAVSAGLLLALAPIVREWHPTRVIKRAGGARSSLRDLNRPLAIAIASTATIGIVLGVFDISVTAFAKSHGHPGQAGAVLAAFSLAGIVGALIYGSRSWSLPTHSLYAWMFAWLGAGLALLPLAGDVTGLLALTVIPGFALTPIFVANSVLIGELSRGIPTAAAFSGVSSAVMLGFSLGSAVAGALVDSHGTGRAFALAAAVAALGTLPAVACGRPVVRESGGAG